jgi:hypothetical protein
VFLVLAHDRRRILHFNVIRHPTTEWTGQQREKTEQEFCFSNNLRLSRFRVDLLIDALYPPSQKRGSL